MFRLKAMLVAKTVLRPWRTGWSVDRAVAFSLPARPPTAIEPPARRDGPVGAERACFIDEDWMVPPDTTEVPTDGGEAAETAPDSGCEEISEPGSVRAWWSLSGKPSRT